MSVYSYRLLIRVLLSGIDQIKERCNLSLANYRQATDNNTVEYKKLLSNDDGLSKRVASKLRQVERMQASIAHWKAKISQNKQECEERNVAVRIEKDGLQKHFQELKVRMTRFREEERRRLIDLAANSKECTGKLEDQLKLAERIVKTSELCRYV